MVEPMTAVFAAITAVEQRAIYGHDLCDWPTDLLRRGVPSTA